jgi:homopolymeric O-antigen transport system ATP-binding protein
MSDTAILCEGLSKRYPLGQDRGYKALRDAISDAAAVPFRRLRSVMSNGNGTSRSLFPNNPVRDSIWALDDVSFEVKRGEVVGIIGRNGAGKSTLLKILSRITRPTKGHAEVNGRVGSLLEVGTGFHPELTGRENIYLNGAILGMRKAEIARKFDEIVAFAEVEKFIDTAVKRYSSGMYVRLAFAVAAHMETEVLLVDEVLAVGDAQFQKKCLGKMGDVARQGRTVLFVSHSMPSVTRLCEKGILLGDGQVLMAAPIMETTREYLRSNLGTTAQRVWPHRETAPGDEVARLKAVRVISQGVVTETVDIRRSVKIELEYWNQKPGAVLLPAVTFIDDQGTLLFASAPFADPQWEGRPMPTGHYRAECVVPGNFLTEGQIRVCAEISTREPMYQIHCIEFDAVCFQVVETGEPGSVRGGWGRHIPGVVRPMLDWHSEIVSTALYDDC